MARRKATIHNPEDDAYTEEEPLDPYAAFAAAFLQRVVRDAGGMIERGVGRHYRYKVKYEAQQFLADDKAVEFWIEMTGCDSEKVFSILREGQR
jgi:hypothetical protein